MLHRLAFVIGLLVAFTLATTSALAQPAADPPDEAVRARATGLKTRGDEAVDAGLLLEAVELYSSSLMLFDEPRARYNRGRTLATLGRYANALADLEVFEKTAPPDMLARVSRLPELLARVRSHVSRVTIACDTPGARVRFRGLDVGTTPVARELVVDSGAAAIEVSLEGYFEYKRDLDLPGAGRSTIEVHLTPKATMGVLRVTSRILGASVRVDDAPVGAVPAEVPLRGGSHRVVVTKEGYEPRSTNVTIEPGATRDVDLTLTAEASLASRWWFWTAIGVGVIGGAVTVYALTTEREADKGSLPPGNFSVGFRGF